MMNLDTLIVEEKEGILRITLNRPDKLNALNAKVYGEMGKIIHEIQSSDSIKVIVITGKGRAFCAGGDIMELSGVTGSVEAAQRRLRISHGIAASIRRIRQPIIMAINGDAVGAGCTMALNGDLRIASRTARFGISFIRIGLNPDVGGIYNLTRLVGIGKAMELSLLGDLIDAEEAKRIGLLNMVVEPETLEAAAWEWATRLAKSSPLALTLTKAALYKGLNMDFFSELEDEVNVQSICLTSQDARNAMQAFIEKRRSTEK